MSGLRRAETDPIATFLRAWVTGWGGSEVRGPGNEDRSVTFVRKAAKLIGGAMGEGAETLGGLARPRALDLAGAGPA